MRISQGEKGKFFLITKKTELFVSFIYLVDFLFLQNNEIDALFNSHVFALPPFHKHFRE